MDRMISWAEWSFVLNLCCDIKEFRPSFSQKQEGGALHQGEKGNQ